jgi:hypothetical protein
MNPTLINRSFVKNKSGRMSQVATALEAAQHQKFCALVTGEEGFFYLEYGHATKWCVCPNDEPPRIRMMLARWKFMLTDIWGEMATIEVFPAGRSVVQT